MRIGVPQQPGECRANHTGERGHHEHLRPENAGRLARQHAYQLPPGHHRMLQPESEISDQREGYQTGGHHQEQRGGTKRYVGFLSFARGAHARNDQPNVQ